MYVIPRVDYCGDEDPNHYAFRMALNDCLTAAEARREVQRRAMVDVGPVVYFVRFGSHIKIGRSVQLWRRLAQLKRTPEDLLAVVPGGKAEEQEFHRRFAAAKVYAELFAPTDDLLAYVNGLRAAAGVGAFLPRT